MEINAFMSKVFVCRHLVNTSSSCAALSSQPTSSSERAQQRSLQCRAHVWFWLHACTHTHTHTPTSIVTKFAKGFMYLVARPQPGRGEGLEGEGLLLLPPAGVLVVADGPHSSDEVGAVHGSATAPTHVDLVQVSAARDGPLLLSGRQHRLGGRGGRGGEEGMISTC